MARATQSLHRRDPDDDEMTEVYNGLDRLCSASRSEGFPNVVAEAMACGVPCGVTDVGDSARVAGRYGVAVPPGDARFGSLLDAPAP